MKLVVHRATSQIGGNCIELASGASRLVLDVGRPLDAPREAHDLLPPTLETASAVDGVLVSHPHQDHFGLLSELPLLWPLYAGPSAAALMDLTMSIFGPPLGRKFRTWKDRTPFGVGAFKVTPFLTDHSAFDAYMLLIEAEGRRVLYTGDFRMHGRKAALVYRLARELAGSIDVLLVEGTNLGSDKPTLSEQDLEARFANLFRETAGRVFVCWSAQNVDRTVTLYRACLQTGRTLVVDLYTAEVLQMLAAAGRIPQPGWQAMKVVITRSFARLYRAKGREDHIRALVQHALPARALSESPSRWVAMIRPSLIRDFRAQGVLPSAEDAWSYSQWSGYLRQPDGRLLQTWFDEGRARACHLHTSGHASVRDLQEFARVLGARSVVPIHGVAWDTAEHGLENIHRLADGQPIDI
ncbi:MAG: MBL fold metallo-hydrolase [Ramlibacter sp.]